MLFALLWVETPKKMKELQKVGDSNRRIISIWTKWFQLKIHLRSTIVGIPWSQTINWDETVLRTNHRAYFWRIWLTPNVILGKRFSDSYVRCQKYNQCWRRGVRNHPSTDKLYLFSVTIIALHFSRLIFFSPGQSIVSVSSQSFSSARSSWTLSVFYYLQCDCYRYRTWRVQSAKRPRVISAKYMEVPSLAICPWL